MDLEKLNELLIEKEVKNASKLNREILLEAVNYLETTDRWHEVDGERVYCEHDIASIYQKKKRYMPVAVHNLGYRLIDRNEFIDIGIKKFMEALPQSEVELNTKPQEVEQKYNPRKGVYGIYLDGVLVYIGKTSISFAKRWTEHSRAAKKYIEGGWQQDYLYKAMRQAKEVRFEELIVANDFSNHEIECMEYALITFNKPQFNYQGVKAPYEFTEKKENK